MTTDNEPRVVTEVTDAMREAALKSLEAWKALPEDERNGERPFIMGFNDGWDEREASCRAREAELVRVLGNAQIVLENAARVLAVANYPKMSALLVEHAEKAALARAKATTDATGEGRWCDCPEQYCLPDKLTNGGKCRAGVKS